MASLLRGRLAFYALNYGKNKIMKTLLPIFLLVYSSSIFGAVYETVTSGDWTAPTTWNCLSLPADCSSFPGVGDVVTINHPCS